MTIQQQASIFNSVNAKVSYLNAEILNKNRLFLRPQVSLKSKTNTNEWLRGYLVHPQITQISERSL